MKYLYLLLVFSTFSNSTYSQDCLSSLQLQLVNIRGGFFSNQSVTFKAKGTGEVFKQTTDAKGTVTMNLPCETVFDVTVSNYTQPLEMESSSHNGATMMRSMSYEPNMAEKDAVFALSAKEKAIMDKALQTLPDTTFIKNSQMSQPSGIDNYMQLIVSLKDFDNGPLIKEAIILTGEKRNLSFKGQTDVTGKIIMYLPKGDKYAIHFNHAANYATKDIRYAKGQSNGKLQLTYIGTKEFERRKKLEEERIIAEEKRLAKEKADFEAYCERMKLTEKEGFERRMKEAYGGESQDSVVSATLNRNNWSEKLIVCDLTGSMDPYAAQLAAWYELNYRKEKNLQFVFFNDGDNKSDDNKIIGKTGGIYYQSAQGLDSLTSLMGKVRVRGDGGDCAENNMEALIKGKRMSNPYKELVMIVDNNAPVKDLILLKDFKEPIHIILCGAIDNAVLLDYLLIAWKNHGSIHTIEEDIYKIAKLSEGERITISGKNYKIMGGQFYLME